MHLSVAGLFDHWSDSSAYTIHTHLEECSDTILTIFYLRLVEEIQRHPMCEELTITMDNKGTAKNYVTIAFVEYLVVQLRCLKRIRLLFLMKGHTVNIQDVLNYPFASAFYNMEGSLFER